MSIGTPRRTLIAVFTMLLASGTVAQPAPATPTAGFDVPTTKMLAIGTFTAKGSPSQWKPLLRAEVRDTVRLYLTGKIEQWYLKPDQSGVVFIINTTDPKEALDLLGRFPFGQAGLMEFQIIPLAPIGPLRVLLDDSAQ
jgi:hypothetical protein